MLRREAGQAAGVVALILTGLACLLWLPTLGLWRATFPVMVVLEPLHLILYGGWRWWRVREYTRRLSISCDLAAPKFGVTHAFTPPARAR